MEYHRHWVGDTIGVASLEIHSRSHHILRVNLRGLENFQITNQRNLEQRMGPQKEKILISNKKAYHEYNIIEDFIAGVQLVGPEVKSIRVGNVSIKEAYCYFIDGELFIKSMNIIQYKEATYNNVDPLRDRKLLLTKRELSKLNKEVQVNGLTIVPLSLFINGRGLVKIKIALAKGKKLYDKRLDIKKEDLKRELNLKLKK